MSEAYFHTRLGALEVIARELAALREEAAALGEESPASLLDSAWQAIASLLLKLPAPAEGSVRARSAQAGRERLPARERSAVVSGAIPLKTAEAVADWSRKEQDHSPDRQSPPSMFRLTGKL